MKKKKIITIKNVVKYNEIINTKKYVKRKNNNK